MFTLLKHFNLNLNMVPCDQCGNAAQTRFHIEALIETRKLCPKGYIVDNQEITDSSLHAYFASAPLWRGSCEQLASMISCWLFEACEGRADKITVAIENRDIAPPANSRITFVRTDWTECPQMTPVYDVEPALAACEVTF